MTDDCLLAPRVRPLVCRDPVESRPPASSGAPPKVDVGDRFERRPGLLGRVAASAVTGFLPPTVLGTNERREPEFAGRRGLDALQAVDRRLAGRVNAAGREAAHYASAAVAVAGAASSALSVASAGAGRTALVAAARQPVVAALGAHRPTFVFRGAGTGPEAVFERGFVAREAGPGVTTELAKHAKGVKSVFIGTSTDPKVAREMAKDRLGWVYVIRRGSEGRDVNLALGRASPYASEAEIAFPNRIPPSQIVGARAVDPETGRFVGGLLKNPKHRP